MTTPETQGSEFPEGLPQPLSKRGKKALFFTVAGVATVVFGFIVFSGGKPAKAETALSQKPRKAAADTQEYERSMPGPLLVDHSPKADPSNNPLQQVLARKEPPGLAAAAQGAPEAHIPVEPTSYVSPSGAGAGAVPAAYQLPRNVQRRLGEDYQRMVSHFKGRQQWALSEEALNKTSGANLTAAVSEPLKHLIENPGLTVSGMMYTVPSGTRIIAVTESKVSSDHPGFFTATVVMPYALKGAKVICQSGANVRDRIPIQPVKLILSDSTEQALTGQVQTDFPGFDGNVTTHYMARLGPAVTNAAIGGAFAAWALSRPPSGANIDTRDAIVAPVVQSSVEGLQNEITRLGGDYPNTVEVPAGKQFTILVTDPFTIKR
jgi:type IV secretory pathway VirB10-like protein